VSIGDPRERSGEARVEPQRCAVLVHRLLGGARGALREVVIALDEVVVGLGTPRRTSGEGRSLSRKQSARDDTRHGAGDALLEVEQVGLGAVVLLAPETHAGGGPDEFYGDAEPSAGAPHAAAHQVRDAQRPPELLGIELGGSVATHGVAGLHDQPLDPPELGDELFGKPLGEVRIGGVPREVVEVQHRDAVGRHPGLAPGVSASGPARRRGAVGALGGGRSDGRTDGE